MEEFQEFIEKHIIPITEKIGRQRHLQAIRDGVIHVLPLILIGSFFLLVSNPPWSFLNNMVKPFTPTLLIPYRLTFGLISIYVTAAIAYSLGRSYKMEGISTAITSAVIFFISAFPRAQITLGNRIANTLPQDDKGYIMPMMYFGTGGLFLAIIIALIVVELLRFFKNKKLMFTMPEGVPEGVTRAFEAIIPTLFVILIFWIIRDLLKIDLPVLVTSIFSPINKLGDSLFAAIVLTVVDSIVWFAGIHPVAAIGPFARPVWLKLITENADTVARLGRGVVLPHIAVDQFYYWFMWVGGSGASLGLVIHLLFARSKFLRQLGKMCLLPGLFNINEPLVFGLPIVANPLMIIPFTLAPVLGGIVSYIAFYLNLIHRPYVTAPWTLPAPFGAFVSTGGDWRAAVMSMIVIGISIAVYYPFIRIYDEKMVAREKEEEEEFEEQFEEEEEFEEEKTRPEMKESREGKSTEQTPEQEQDNERPEKKEE